MRRLYTQDKPKRLRQANFKTNTLYLACLQKEREKRFKVSGEVVSLSLQLNQIIKAHLKKKGYEV